MNSLHGTREDEEKETEGWTGSSWKPYNFKAQNPYAVETQSESVPSRMVSGNSEEGKGWKLVTSGTERWATALTEGLQL